MFKEGADCVREVVGKFEVVSGGAKGADVLASKWCKENKVPIREYLPDYRSHNDAFAPLFRNTKIADEVDAAVVWWDGRSKGSHDVIKKMIDRKKPVLLFPGKV